VLVCLLFWKIKSRLVCAWHPVVIKLMLFTNHFPLCFECRMISLVAQDVSTFLKGTPALVGMNSWVWFQTWLVISIKNHLLIWLRLRWSLSCAVLALDMFVSVEIVLPLQLKHSQCLRIVGQLIWAV
jgi:ABC-type arginine/histidine transport system permease subunit